MRYALVIALMCAFVAGCGKSPSDEMKSNVEHVKSTAKKAEDTVFGGSVKALDKAKGVGQSLMDSAAEQRRQIDKESE